MKGKKKRQFRPNVFQLVVNFQKEKRTSAPEKTRPEFGSSVRSEGAGARGGWGVLGEVGSVSINKALWLLANWAVMSAERRR